MESRVDIEKLAEKVFGDKEKAADWLSTPKRTLGGKSAIDMLDNPGGIATIKGMLLQIDEGYF